jgi:hypothetical protein
MITDPSDCYNGCNFSAKAHIPYGLLGNWPSQGNEINVLVIPKPENILFLTHF